MSHAYVEVTDQNFDSTVLKSDKPVVVDFWAEWCGPCRMMAPRFEELANEFAGKMVFAKMDTDANLNVASRYGIQSIPTLLFFANGNIVESVIGVRPKEDLKRYIESVIAARA